MVNVKRSELPRMVLEPITCHLDLVCRNILPLFLEDRDDVGRRTRRNRDQQELKRTRSRTSITFCVNGLSVTAWRRSDKKIIARPTHCCLISVSRHSVAYWG